MKYSKFQEITNAIKKQDKVISKLYKQKVDLLDFVDPYHVIISELIKEIYGEVGYDWWSWFCYENDFGEGKLEAWDETKKPICYDLKSLWEYLETQKPNKKPQI